MTFVEDEACTFRLRVELPLLADCGGFDDALSKSYRWTVGALAEAVRRPSR